MIRVNCIGCGKRLKVPEAGAGRTVKCPRCGGNVQVPTISASAETEAGELPELDLSKEPILGPLFEPEDPPPPSQSANLPRPPTARPAVPPAPPPSPLLPPIPPKPLPPIPPQEIPADDVEVEEDDDPSTPPTSLPPPPPPSLPEVKPAISQPAMPPVPAASSPAAKGFRYVLEGPGWLGKMALGGVIVSFPVLEAVGDGYRIRTLRNLRAGMEHPLPDWDDFDGLFKTGLPLRLVIYAMCLPAIGLSLWVCYLDAEWLSRNFGGAETATESSVAGMIFNWAVVPLLNVVLLVFQSVLFLTVPVLVRRLTDGDSIPRLFDPRPALRLIQINLKSYVTAWASVLLMLLAFGIVAGFLGVIGLVIVIGPLLGWVLLSIGRFWGWLTWAYHLNHMRAPTTGASTTG